MAAKSEAFTEKFIEKVAVINAFFENLGHEDAYKKNYKVDDLFWISHIVENSVDNAKSKKIEGYVYSDRKKGLYKVVDDKVIYIDINGTYDIINNYYEIVWGYIKDKIKELESYNNNTYTDKTLIQSVILLTKSADEKDLTEVLKHLTNILKIFKKIFKDSESYANNPMQMVYKMNNRIEDDLRRPSGKQGGGKSRRRKKTSKRKKSSKRKKTSKRNKY